MHESLKDTHGDCHCVLLEQTPLDKLVLRYPGVTHSGTVTLSHGVQVLTDGLIPV